MIKRKISIIGAGHIGTAIFKGLKRNKKCGLKFMLTGPRPERLEKLKKEYPVEITSDNRKAAKWADVVIIAVRPNVVQEVINDVKRVIKQNQIVISVAACVPMDLLEKYFGRKVKLARIMPNIPVAYGKGVVGLLVNKKINNVEKKLIHNLFNPLGTVINCRTDVDLDKLSMISGCGPGYVSYFMHHLQGIAERYGFPQADARRIVLATFTGTIEHLRRTKITYREMINSIVTKGGITEEVILSMDESNFPEILSKSINRGYDKIKRVSKEL